MTMTLTKRIPTLAGAARSRAAARRADRAARRGGLCGETLACDGLRGRGGEHAAGQDAASAAAGDTIVFDQNCTITLTTGTLTLTQNVTIDGTGHTVIVDGGCTLTNAASATPWRGDGLRGEQRGDGEPDGPDDPARHMASATAAASQQRRHADGDEQHPLRQLHHRHRRRHLQQCGTLTVTNSTLSGNTAHGDRRRHLQPQRHR